MCVNESVFHNCYIFRVSSGILLAHVMKCNSVKSHNDKIRMHTFNVCGLIVLYSIIQTTGFSRSSVSLVEKSNFWAVQKLFLLMWIAIFTKMRNTYTAAFVRATFSWIVSVLGYFLGRVKSFIVLSFNLLYSRCYWLV